MKASRVVFLRTFLYLCWAHTGRLIGTTEKNHSRQHSYGKFLHVNMTLKAKIVFPFVKKSFCGQSLISQLKMCPSITLNVKQFIENQFLLFIVIIIIIRWCWSGSSDEWKLCPLWKFQGSRQEQNLSLFFVCFSFRSLIGLRINVLWKYIWFWHGSSM